MLYTFLHITYGGYTIIKNDIVHKDEKKHLLTAPVLVPDRPDCDACRGEEPLTPNQIERMAHSYKEKYRIDDKLHDYHTTKQNVAYPVASWILETPMKYENIRGDSVNLPIGTWMATVKVADDDTWQRV
ncbi:MAG: XkdF-like putative serine protease domain-containing protein, partial [Candidatus Subteraquimicrobiales bacterium]|nr:XkdF-like putative serine protease domain-containing protein [Candidatus Subteraquimicrobiales bacterium]